MPGYVLMTRSLQAGLVPIR